MFGSIFRPYGRVWTILNHITDILGLSLLWCLCCIPIVTIAPATTALYDAAVHGIRYGEEVIYRRFLRTFRQELKTGIGVTLLWGSILLFCAYVLALLQEAGLQDSRAALMAGAYRAVMLFPIAAACWSVTIASRFTYGFRGLTAVAVRYLPGHLFSSLALGTFSWIVFWFCCEYPLALTFAPALCALIWSLPVEWVFQKYHAGIAPEQES